MNSKRRNKKTVRAHGLKQFFKSTDNILFIAGLLAIVFVFALFLPFKYHKTVTKTINYNTQYKTEASIELGTIQKVQEGKSGSKSVTYQYQQSLFNYLFNKEKAEKKVLKSHETKHATDLVVLKGSRKWQYMKCSNGTYRYYTDAQFADPNTGFTSKSPDYCAENNQGTKVSLADSLSGANNITKPSYVPAGCQTIDVPYKTVYKDASWLNVGQTSQGYGINGYKSVCKNAALNYTINPIDMIVYRGTGTPSTYTYTPPPPSTPTQNASAKYICDRDYNNAKAKLALGNASNSSAAQQIEILYRQCLSNAGY